MDNPIILSSYDPGIHGRDLNKTVSRLNKESTWKDLSCIIITPASGTIPTKIVSSWLGMIKPPNNKSIHLFAVGTEVGEAYSQMIEGILAHPELNTWKYILCIEHDNSPPSDGLLKLLGQMEEHPEYAAIGGLYFTKGDGGVAQIWGNPREHPINFMPQIPDPNGGLVECNGTGMGFTVFRLNMFKDKRLQRPLFKTVQSKEEGLGTQDLYFWKGARQLGYRCAIDCSVKVGHYSLTDDTMW